MACVCVLRKPTTGGRRRAAPPSTAPNAHAEGPRRPAEAGPWGAAEGPVAQLFSWARIWGLEWVRRRLPPLPPPPKKLGGEIEFLLGLLTYLQLYPDTMYQPPVGRRLSLPGRNSFTVRPRNGVITSIVMIAYVGTLPTESARPW